MTSDIRQIAPQRFGRKPTDRLCEVWNKRMRGCKGPAQPSPMLGDALNDLGFDTHQTVALDIRRPKETTLIHELER